jgi:antitoxin FitA
VHRVPTPVNSPQASNQLWRRQHNPGTLFTPKWRPPTCLYAARKSGKLAFWRHRRQNGAMPSVQIKDVPERTHAILRQRAAAAHQSLQEYLRARLIEEADQPTLEEILDRAGGRSGGSVPLEDAAAAIRDDRDRR